MTLVIQAWDHPVVSNGGLYRTCARGPVSVLLKHSPSNVAAPVQQFPLQTLSQCYVVLQEAANQNNFSDPSKRTLMTGLAVASAAHVAVFLPLLNTNESGALLFPVGFIWGVSAVASALIAIKPSE